MEKTVDLEELFFILYRKIIWIILSAVFFAGVSFAWFYFAVTPVYQAEAMLYVNNNSKLTSKDLAAVNINDLNASQKLVNTYIVILQNHEVLNKVIKDCNLSITPEQLKHKVLMQAVNNTEVLSIKVTDINPKKAAEIANSFTKIVPNEIIRIVKAGSVEVISPALVPVSPSGPRTIRNTIIAAMLGMILAVVIIILIDLLDTTVKDSQDLLNRYGLPILGEVPDIELIIKTGGKKYGK